MTDQRQLPALAPDVELADFETEIVALVPGRRRAVLLEGGHAVVLDSCRRRDGIDAVVADISRVSGDDPVQVEGWLDGVLQELARVGVLTARGAIDATPTNGRSDSDRSS